jgi:hypothetical protein
MGASRVFLATPRNHIEEGGGEAEAEAER